MVDELSFSYEMATSCMLHMGSRLRTACSAELVPGTCPAVEFMDHTPRQIIGMIRADLKQEVLASNTYWTCASCYHCTVGCPADIDIARYDVSLEALLDVER